MSPTVKFNKKCYMLFPYWQKFKCVVIYEAIPHFSQNFIVSNYFRLTRIRIPLNIDEKQIDVNSKPHAHNS